MIIDTAMFIKLVANSYVTLSLYHFVLLKYLHHRNKIYHLLRRKQLFLTIVLVRERGFLVSIGMPSPVLGDSCTARL